MKGNMMTPLLLDEKKDDNSPPSATKTVTAHIDKYNGHPIRAIGLWITHVWSDNFQSNKMTMILSERSTVYE